MHVQYLKLNTKMKICKIAKSNTIWYNKNVPLKQKNPNKAKYGAKLGRKGENNGRRKSKSD